MQGSMMDFPLTLPHILERAGKLFADVEIVSRLPDKSLHRYTYADFRRRSRQLAQALRQVGLKRGDRVATLLWNHYVHLECYFGIPISGGVLHTLNLRLDPHDIAYIVNHAEDRFLIVDDTLLPLYQKIKDRIRVEKVLVAALASPRAPEPFVDYEQFLAGAEGEFEYPDLEENEALGMCYTSGTTGRPKGVVYSHRAIVLHSIVECMPDVLDLSQRDTTLAIVPMFHANAWGMPFASVLAGCKQVFPGPHMDAESLLDLFQREKVTFTAGVPTIWFSILQELKADPTRWELTPGMRMAVGGSAAPESMIREFDRFDLTVLHAWGMTETAPLGTLSRLKSSLASAPPDEQYAVRSKQGLPVPYVEIRAVGDDGEVAWDGETMGELQVRGPWIASAYHNEPASADRWTDDGWFRTGDVATIDPEGYMKITDRTKDLIKTGGEWISSVDMENLLMAHPAVAEAAVVAIPHPKWTERPLAAVVLKKGRSATADELRAHLDQSFAKWQLPDHFAFVDALPHTSTGKFLKSKLREMFKDYGAGETQAD